MSKPYFRQVPDFDYVSRDSNQRQISQYATVKNLFRRGKLRDDIFGNLSFFTKYKIIGDERPDNVAYKVYNDETLDWVILLSNNILNIQSEWPLPQSVFDKVMLEKYGSYEAFNSIHHYETKEVRDSLGNLVLPSGIQMQNNWKGGNGFIQGYKVFGATQIFDTTVTNEYVVSLATQIPGITKLSKVIINGASNDNLNGSFDVNGIFDDFYSFTFTGKGPVGKNNLGRIDLTGNETFEFLSTDPIPESNNYYYQYYDNNLENTVLLPSASILTPITNYDYEIQKEEAKRNIYVLKPRYLNIVFNDLDEIMAYKKGSSQYVSEDLKRGDNIRLYK